MTRRHATTVAGLLLVTLALGFCIDTFLDERREVDAALGSAQVGWLAVAVVLAAAAVATLVEGWRRCLGLLGASPTRRDVSRWYLVGELGKYLPGGIWPILGRGELARRGGIAAAVAYQSVLLSLAAWMCAAVAPAALIGARPRVQEAAIGVIRRLSGGRVSLEVLPFGALVRLVASYLPTWLLIGGSAMAVSAALGGGADGRVAAAATVAWVAGFLAVPVPAGAGVREAVFVATSGLAEGQALAVAVTGRLVFIAVDVVGAAGSAARRRPGRNRLNSRPGPADYPV